MNKAAAPLVMSAGQRGSLVVLARSSTAAHRAVQRARVLVLAADGVANAKIAAGVGVTPVTVRAWRDRFAREGLAKFARVRAGRGRKPLISADKIEEIIRLTQHETPAGATHWSLSVDGEAGRGQSGHGPADLVRAGSEAAPPQDVQALE